MGFPGLLHRLESGEVKAGISSRFEWRCGFCEGGVEEIAVPKDAWAGNVDMTHDWGFVRVKTGMAPAHRSFPKLTDRGQPGLTLPKPLFAFLLI